MDLGQKLKLVERLGRLRAEGALSDKEFAAEKAKLLGTVAAGEVPTEKPPYPSEADADKLIEDYHARSTSYGETAGPKLLGAALALLIVAGSGYWFVQSGSAASPSDSVIGRSGQSTRDAQQKTASIPVRDQLVGTWGSDDGECDGGEVTLRQDGTYVTQEGEGGWSFTNGRLALTDWNPSSAQIVAKGAGRLQVAWTGGPTEVWRRCKPMAVSARQHQLDGDLAAAAVDVERSADAVEDAMRDVEAAVYNADEAIAVAQD